MDAIADVDELVDVLTRRDAGDDGEDLPLLAHHLQTAAQLASSAPDDLELQVAGLVHDIGSIVDPHQPLTHARTGAELVRPLLGSRIAELVAQHDQAKRYLVAVDAAYLGHLSAQSVTTLEVQGGALDDAHVREFSHRPDFEACVMLRHADDAAKVPGRPVPTLETWRPALDRCARAVRPR
jgi:predicted HD phosphohydrolase